MKLKILSMHGEGDIDREHVLLKVVEGCDLSAYILADTTYGSGRWPEAKVRHTFWFPAKEVKPDELVSVWTRKGKHTVGETSRKKRVHRFFWGLERAVWSDFGDYAAILEVVESKVARRAPPPKRAGLPGWRGFQGRTRVPDNQTDRRDDDDA